MYEKKEFKSVLEAIKYLKEQNVETRQIRYIASRNDKCELVLSIA